MLVGLVPPVSVDRDFETESLEDVMDVTTLQDWN